MFEWNAEKALINLLKHQVSFEEAASCFDDPEVMMFHDLAHSTELEDRYSVIAKSNQSRLLAFVFTVRKSLDGEENLRIITARRANKNEKKVYSRA